MMQNFRGTKTTQGFVPHLQMRTKSGINFDAPVKLCVASHYSGGRDPTDGKLKFAPVMCGEYLVFALPGGGEILDKAEPPKMKGTK